MGPEGNKPDQPEEGHDDLFEDLDTFFSSMGEDDWPEPLDASSEGSRDEPTAGEASGQEPGNPEGPPEGLPSGGIPDEPATPPGLSRPAEMTSADWSRLRDVLGEQSDEVDEEVPYSGAPSSAEEALFGYAGADEESEEGTDAMSGMWETGAGEEGAADGGGEGPSGDEDRPELTLEDLKKAPPEYRDLPPPPDAPPLPGAAEPVGAAPGDKESWERPAPSETRSFDVPAGNLESSLSEPLGTPDRPTGSGGVESQDPMAPEERLPPAIEDEPDEPTLAELQAAADRVAGQFEPTGETPGGVDDDLLADLTEPKGPRTVKVGEPESMLGPSWEDPTARTLGADPSRPPRLGGSRDVPLAVITGVGLGLIAIITLIIASAAFAVVAGLVILIAQAELYATMQRRGFQPATAIGLVLGGFTLAGAYTRGEPGMLFMLVLSVMLTFLWFMAAPVKLRNGSTANVAATLLGILYVPFFGGFALVILTQANYGKLLLLAVIGLTFLYDITAFVAGSIWGSRPLAPTISPKKSWEGLVGASIVTLGVAIASLPSINPMNAVKAIGFGLVVIVFAPLGDLAESAIKRDLGVKDMGTIMPGHGGALDRIDSVLFVAPAIFYFLRLIF